MKFKKILATVLSASILMTGAATFANAQQTMDPLVKRVELQSQQLIENDTKLVGYVRIAMDNKDTHKELGIAVAKDNDFRYGEDRVSNLDPKNKFKYDWTINEDDGYGNQYVKFTYEDNGKKLNYMRYYVFYKEDGHVEALDQNVVDGERMNYGTGCTIGGNGCSITSVDGRYPVRTRKVYANVDIFRNRTEVKHVAIKKAGTNETWFMKKVGADRRADGHFIGNYESPQIPMKNESDRFYLEVAYMREQTPTAYDSLGGKNYSFDTFTKWDPIK